MEQRCMCSNFLSIIYSVNMFWGCIKHLLGIRIDGSAIKALYMFLIFTIANNIA